MRSLLARLDGAVLKVEALLCVAFLAAMSVLVFLDVVHRVASSPEGRLEVMLKGAFGGAEAADAAIAGLVAPGLTAAFWALLVYAALRTARRETPVPQGKAVGIAVGVSLGLWAVIELYLWALPNGLVWAQPVALAMMLWTGFLGASIATKVGAHIVLEVMEFVIPSRVKPYAAGAGSTFAAAFFAFLVVISWLFVVSYYDEWVETDGDAGVIEGVPIPKFVVYGILPLSFSIMTFRFLGRAAIGFSGKEPPKPDDEKPRDAEPAGEGA